MEIENVRASSPFDDPSRMGGKSPAPKKRKATNKLDSDEMRRLHSELMDRFHEERDRQSLNRYQMAIDEDYFDGLQWSEEDAQVLAGRDQAPLVFNKILPSIEWLTGTEKRTRMDNRVLPREESDENGAEVKQKLMKYINDANNYSFASSDAFHDAAVAGLGWLEEGVNTEAGQELIYRGSESWRNVLHDSLSTRRDLGDGRHLFRWKYLDLDVAVALFPNRANYLKSAAADTDELVERDQDIWYLGARVNNEESDFLSSSRMSHVRSPESGGFTRRQRVKIIECWYKKPMAAQVMRGGGEFDGQLYEPGNQAHDSALTDGIVTLANTLHQQMRVMICTDDHVLFEGESPYAHNMFPLTPIWCYRRKRDGMPYGKVRQVRDAQDDLNKRASKALYILSANQIIMDHDAVDAKDIENLRDEASNPNGIIRKKKGSDLEFRQDKQLAEQHIMLMDRDARMIQDVGGTTDENLGKRTNATSGIAIERRQEQGATITFNLFDAKRFAEQLSGQKVLALMEQFYTAEKAVRIVGEKKPIEWIKINAYDPVTGKILNPVTAHKADFIVGEQDYRQSLRTAMFEQLMDMISKIAPVMPQAAVNLLDLVVEMADVPNREEMVARIRKINGQNDPSRKPDPQQEGIKAEQDAMAKRIAMLNMDKLEAEVGKIKAGTKQLDAQSFAKLVEGMYAALQAAQVVVANPTAAPVGDVIAQGAGFKDQGGQDPNIPQPAMQMPQLQAPQNAMPEQPMMADGMNQGIETPQADGVIQ